MKIDAETIWADVLKIRARAPLVHNITNYVVMNSSANALLALGASPVMAHAEEEVADMVKLAGALVINIGTLSPRWVEAMARAARQAHALGIPIVLDPVGAGATPYRTETTRRLIAETPPTILRGNASEIMALVAAEALTKGVDSTASSDTALEAARQLSLAHGCTVCVSGATDYVLAEDTLIRVHNGHPLMPRVTGLGCTASALCGAFAAVNDSPPAAAAHAMAVLGIAGELAAACSAGPGSLQVNLLDALYNLSAEQIAARLQLEA
ncbi:MAG: hydroxyethylthiazole kinase [Chloroflexi bacterium]|nr:hydroxyethylthiazole kinase [Chloroflexota bacterium]